MERKLINSGCVRLYKPSWKCNEVYSLQVKNNKLVVTQGSVLCNTLSRSEEIFKNKNQALRKAIYLLRKTRNEGYKFKCELKTRFDTLPEELIVMVWSKVYNNVMKQLVDEYKHEVLYTLEKGNFNGIQYVYVKEWSVSNKGNKSVVFTDSNRGLVFKKYVCENSLDMVTMISLFEGSSVTLLLETNMLYNFLELSKEQKIRVLNDNGTISRTRYGLKNKTDRELLALFNKL